MSSTIIYHQIAVRIPADHAGSTEDLFVIMSQSGSSNCYEQGRGGRRSRQWTAQSFGTMKEVLEEGIRIAGHTEGGMLQMGSASTGATPEKFIRKVRSLLSEAITTDVRRADLLYKGQRVALSIAYREPEVEGRSNTTPYNIQDPVSFSAFWQRYQAENGGSQRAWRFFEVSGPELR